MIEYDNVIDNKKAQIKTIRLLLTKIFNSKKMKKSPKRTLCLLTFTHK